MANERAADEEVRAITDAELVKIRAILLELADGTELQRQFRWALGCLLARYDADAERIAELTSANATAELNGLAAEQRHIREIVETSDSYVPQDIAAECLLMLKPLDEPGKPNTLIALVERAMERIAELERVTGPVMPCGCYAVECVQLFGFRGLCEGHFRKPVDGALLFCRRYGLDHTAANPMEITPEYLAWMESR